MSDGPFEPEDGQDGPPNLRQTLRVAILLLADLREHLDHFADEASVDLRDRSGAVRNALIRLRERHDSE